MSIISKSEDVYFSNGKEAEQFWLGCVACGGESVHQIRAEVFFRRTEDADDGYHVIASNLHFFGDSSMRGNPSGRRDGISIDFECEECAAITQLHVIQHKGTTYLLSERKE